MATDTRPSARWLTATSWLALLIFAATSTLISVSLKHIGDDLQIGFGMRGALAPARALVLGAATLLVGLLGDRLGKRWFLGGGMFVVALSLVAVWQSTGYVGLLIGLGGVGVGLGGLEGLVSPLAADLHPRNVAVHLGVLHGFFPAGLVVSSFLIGAALDSGVQWRVPFVVVAVPAALVGAMFLLGAYPTHAYHGPGKERLRVRAILGNRTFWLLAAAMMLTAGCEGSLIYWSPNFLQDQYGVGAKVGAAGLMAFSAAMAVGRFGMGAIVRSVSLDRLMLGGAVLFVAVTSCAAGIDNLGVNVACLAAAGLLIACFWPGVLSLATERIATGSATLLAMLAVAGIAGFGILPAVIGIVAERFGLRVGLGMVPATMVVVALILLIAARSAKRSSAGAPDSAD